MKKSLFVLCLALIFAVPAFAQTIPRTPNLGLYVPPIGNQSFQLYTNYNWGLLDADVQPNLGYVTPAQYSGSLQAAVTAGDTNVNGNYNLTSNVTVPAGSELWVSGTITQTGAFTLTINGPFRGSPGCFVGFSAGQVTFSTNTTYSDPLWWNANTNPGTTDMTAAINCAIGAAPLNVPVTILLPRIINTTSLVTFSNILMTLKGAPTLWYFSPTASGPCLQVKNSAAGGTDVYQGAVRDIKFYSSDTTYTKTALDLWQTSNYEISNIYVSGAEIANSTTFWGGAGSIGINTHGHDTTNYHDLQISADVPIEISVNPNWSTDAADHFHFHDCELYANGNPIVTIDSGANVTQLTFDGYQAWALGTYGLYWVDTTTTTVGNGLSLNNVRWELGTNSSGYFAYISHNYGLQNFNVNNCYMGNLNGIYARKVLDILVDHSSYVGTSGKTSVNLDSTCSYGFTSRDTLWVASSTATITGLYLQQWSGALLGSIYPNALYTTQPLMNTWVPTLTFGGASVGLTYTSQVGYWYQVGPIVFASFDITLSNVGSSTGAVTLAGIPIQVGANNRNGSFTMSYYSAMSSITGPIHAYYGGQVVYMWQPTSGSASTITALTNANFTNTSRIQGWVTYSVY